MDATTRQVIAFHVGDRSQVSAEQLWVNIPAVYREQSNLLYGSICCLQRRNSIPEHRAISKRARKTNHIERFNCTLRQRVSRLQVVLSW